MTAKKAPGSCKATYPEIRAAYAVGGVTMRELAKRFGCSTETVSRAVGTISKRPPRMRNTLRMQAVALKREQPSLSATKIAGMTGAVPTNVIKWLRDSGLMSENLGLPKREPDKLLAQLLASGMPPLESFRWQL